MVKNKVCWKITTRCNQHCKYCFGFRNIEDLTYDENINVMNNLIKKGVNHITFTGGEAILYPRLNDLIKYAKSNGVSTKLVTNGIYIAENDDDYVEDILNNLDEINLSIDSVSNEVNSKLGKIDNHCEVIKRVLEKTKNKDIKVGINTVISKVNIDYLQDLGKFLNNYNIYKWKFLKFMPIRNSAYENENKFLISEDKLLIKVKEMQNYGFNNIKIIEYKKQNEFEKSVVVLPNADIIKTDNGADYKLGNASKLETTNLVFKESDDKNIRTLIACSDSNMQEKLINEIGNLENVEIVATSNNSKETLDDILKYKPEMVFLQQDLGSGLSGTEIMKKSKSILGKESPIFNLITKKLTDENYLITKEIIGDKFNSVINVPTLDRIKYIFDGYRKYLVYITLYNMKNRTIKDEIEEKRKQ